jgi:hypothetical protein
MPRLKIETVPYGGAGIVTQRISGFSDGELSELKSMKHKEAKEKLLEMLDDRNNGTGTAWMCGYGVFELWFDNEFAYMNIGSSCD